MPPPRVTNVQLNDKLDELLSEVIQNRRDIGTITTVLKGDLENDRQGLMERTRLLEAAEKTRKKWVGAAIGSAITGVVVAIWNLITGHGG